MGSAGAAWAFSRYLVVRLGLWQVYLRFFGFGVPWSEWGLFSPEAVVFFGGSWIISSGFAGGLWVLVSPLMPWLCYWVLTGVLGSVLVLLVPGCRDHFWIFCSEVMERFN